MLIIPSHILLTKVSNKKKQPKAALLNMVLILFFVSHIGQNIREIDV